MTFRVLADVLFKRGTRMQRDGRPRSALRHFSLAVRMVGSDARYLDAAATAASQAGDRDAATGFCERALVVDPESRSAHALLTKLYLHGPHYLEVLARIHQHLRPRTYVEIGVDLGDSLRLVGPHTRTAAIDPKPAVSFALPENVRLYEQTSDEFFAQRDVLTELGGLPVDLAFIDGMHHFEFALRDFANLERLCTSASTILIHDCFPHDRRTAQRERATNLWSGDIWRLILLLKKYRPDLSIHTIATPPTGLGLVRNLAPASRLLADNMDRLCAEFLALGYSALEHDRAAKLNLLPNDWESIRAVLEAAPSDRVSGAALKTP